MKGLELSEQYYKTHGEQMLQQFPHLLPYLAVGLIGSGSECLGYDDKISQDHDFEPGFCIFLPEEDFISSRDAFQLERAYAKLPNEFMGYNRLKTNPVGGSRHGVIRISDFLCQKIGQPNENLPLNAWLYIDEQFLLEVTNGKIFTDNFGLITNVRNKLAYLPEDIRLKKITGNLIILEQSGQYNYLRCIKRNEISTAQLALNEFTKAAIHLIFLLNRRYMPYYKWQFRTLRELNIPSFLYYNLEYLISGENNLREISYKQEIIHNIILHILNSLLTQGLIKNTSMNLQEQAVIVNNYICDNTIRNMHIMAAV